MRVYISGKIGEEVISDATREKFDRAQKMLEAHFNPEYDTIVNPASEAFQDTMKQAFDWRELRRNLPDILLFDLQWLRTCDAIYMLGDWIESDGANVELDFARAVGMKVLWQREDDALCFCDNKDAWLPIDEDADRIRRNHTEV